MKESLKSYFKEQRKRQEEQKKQNENELKLKKDNINEYNKQLLEYYKKYIEPCKDKNLLYSYDVIESIKKRNEASRRKKQEAVEMKEYYINLGIIDRPKTKEEEEEKKKENNKKKKKELLKSKRKKKNKINKLMQSRGRQR
jgi:hypothetical protein